MRYWKAILGIGTACVACCAAPLLGGVAALTTGSTALAVMGTTLLACAKDLLPLAGGLLAIALAGGGLIWWHRRAAVTDALQAADNTPLACSLPAPARSCGCASGACV